MNLNIKTEVDNIVLKISEGAKVNLTIPATVRVNLTIPSIVNYIYGTINSYIQSTPSDTWIVNHNLGHYPIVTVYNDGMTEIEASVVHTSKNQFIVYLATPMTGVVLYV